MMTHPRNRLTFLMGTLPAIMILLPGFLVSADAASGNRIRTATQSAWTILQRVRQAEAAAGTAHAVGSSIITGTVKTRSGTLKFRDTGMFAGDATTSNRVQGKSHIRELLGFKRGTRSRTVPLEYITSPLKLAMRSQQKQAWKCVPSATLEQIAVWTPASFGFYLTRNDIAPKVSGTTTFGGAPVWRIRYTFVTKNSTSTGGGTLLVDRKRNVILSDRNHSTFHGRTTTYTRVASAKYTKFGESLGFKFPSCGKTGTA